MSFKRRYLWAIFSPLLILMVITARPANTAQNLEDTNPDTISLTFTGDILPHRALYEKAKVNPGYNFNFAFKDIKTLLNADANLCHLETPLTEGRPSTYPVFGTPKQIVPALAWAGFTGCDQASNHTLDKGYTGVSLTKKEFTAQNMFLAGTKIDSADSPISYFSVKGHTVALLAYTYGTNGVKIPNSHPGLVNLINKKSIVKELKIAKSKAELVILYLHWGQEYQEKITTSQEKLASSLTALPYVDIIVGSHAHVLQTAQLVNGKPVLFGLGNFWSGQGSWSNQPKGQISLIAKLEFTFKDGKASYAGGNSYATFVQRGTFAIKNASKSNDPVACLALKEVSRLYNAVLKTQPLCKTKN